MKITDIKTTSVITITISLLLLLATSACSQDDHHQHANSKHSSADHDRQMVNDFPTYARAEYVYVCMSTNGTSEYVLRQCSCAIDEIAKRMTYDDYVAAETAVRMRQMRGERVAQFREVEIIKRSIQVLKNAQAEAEISCF